MSATSSKNCGKCEKIVYPTEEIRCLDRSWHKACFKCTTCGMTLNVKNAKGYDKMPYCNVHYPLPKATAITDNPEMQRVRLLTDIQSNTKYKDSDKSKRGPGPVAEDVSSAAGKGQHHADGEAELPVQGLKISQPTVGHVDDARQMDPVQVNEIECSQKSLKTNESSADTHEHEREVSPDETNGGGQSTPLSHGGALTTQMKVRAVYSYTADDTDEVSFAEGDILEQCETVDDGWLMGTNPKTGERGLLPSNYVEVLD